MNEKWTIRCIVIEFIIVAIVMIGISIRPKEKEYTWIDTIDAGFEIMENDSYIQTIEFVYFDENQVVIVDLGFKDQVSGDMIVYHTDYSEDSKDHNEEKMYLQFTSFGDHYGIYHGEEYISMMELVENNGVISCFLYKEDGTVFELLDVDTAYVSGC